MFFFDDAESIKVDLLKNEYLINFVNDFNLLLCFVLSIVICLFFKNTYQLLDKRIDYSDSIQKNNQ